MVERRFPIMDSSVFQGETIPWNALAPHEHQALENHDQTLQVLARRGGLSWCEAAAILEDRPWHRMPDAEAKAAVLRICAEHQPKDSSHG